MEQHGRYITSLIERQNAGGAALPPPPAPVSFPPALQLQEQPFGGAAAGPSQPVSTAPSSGQLSHVAWPAAHAAAQSGGEQLPAAPPPPDFDGIGAFGSAATEPSNADLLEAPSGYVQEQLQPQGLFDGCEGLDGKAAVHESPEAPGSAQRGRKRRQTADA